VSPSNAQAASNTFLVKDRAAFEEAIAPLDITVRKAGRPSEPGCVYLVAETAHGWPSQPHDEASQAEEGVDLLALIAGHLAPGEVAILKQTGAEDATYLGGIALAVNAAGETAKVDLDEIYARAATLGPHLARDI
jgi:hypothetical protein